MRPALLTAIIFILFQFTSCQTIDVFKRIYSEEAELVQFSNREKNVYFIPMHHVGKKKFYEHVRELVTGLKQHGYIVYYENAAMDDIEDSLTIDTYHRKFRKMMGTHIDSSGYAMLLHEKGLFKTLVDQPSYEDLGVDKKDKRVDISKNKLVDAYEQKYGQIQLNARDSSIALDDDYPLNLRLSPKQLFDIIIDYRNAFLAQNIHSSPDKKILVIYGAMHVDGTLEELKRMDGYWRRK